MIRWLHDRWLWLKWFCTVMSFLLLAAPAHSQGIAIGGETTVTYTGTNAQIVQPNTPASQFTAAGTTTYILPISNPTVSIRLYITNNTANACPGFSVQMFSATDATVSSFNLFLSNWQTVLLQNPSGGLSPILQTLTIPASGAVYVSSTAIVAPRVAVQIVNTTGLCATTNVEITATITQVSVTAPLVSTVGASPNGGSGNVQGVQSEFYNANAINPVLTGGAALPTNSGFLGIGLDSISTNLTQLTNGNQSAFLGSTPAVTQGTGSELAICFESTSGSPGGTSINLPWVNQGGVGSQSISFDSYSPAVQGTILQRKYNGSLGIPEHLISVLATLKQGSPRANFVNFGSGGGFGAGINAAGDALMFAVLCTSGAACSYTSITSGLGVSYAPITPIIVAGASGGNNYSMIVYANTSANPGGNETITLVGLTGTAIMGGLSIASPAQSSINQPVVTPQVDLTGRQVVALDAQSPDQFVCSVTLSTNTTTQCQPAPTLIEGFAVRLYVTDFQIQTTTAGTATVITLKTGTGANCGTGTANLSAITFANTVVGTQTISGFRTPLIAPLQSAVCATQSGTTAGTSVIELHGFIAP